MLVVIDFRILFDYNLVSIKRREEKKRNADFCLLCVKSNEKPHILDGISSVGYGNALRKYMQGRNSGAFICGNTDLTVYFSRIL